MCLCVSSLCFICPFSVALVIIWARGWSGASPSWRAANTPLAGRQSITNHTDCGRKPHKRIQARGCHVLCFCWLCFDSILMCFMFSLDPFSCIVILGFCFQPSSAPFPCVKQSASSRHSRFLQVCLVVPSVWFNSLFYFTRKANPLLFYLFLLWFIVLLCVTLFISYFDTSLPPLSSTQIRCLWQSKCHEVQRHAHIVSIYSSGGRFRTLKKTTPLKKNRFQYCWPRKPVGLLSKYWLRYVTM